MSLDTRSLPLFPLPDVVLFPGSPLPLHIFEPRYREMIATILDGDKLFGVLLIDSRHQVATIGSAAEVIEVEKLPDGRMNILTVGIRRFKVIDTNFDKDYLQGDIQWLDDNASDSEDEENARKMAQEVRDAIKDILDLTSKLNDYHIPMPEDLPLDAESLSFWVASTMYNLAEEQQVLLEMRDTGTRLRNEAEALKMTIKFLAARNALKNAVG
ncbi:MAG: LON peptidase substrate-binding domain-containing protein [Candidatus Melainabacteria bacterium]|jgi:ATP-dependent Lon protease|nr:LON peptidase substrate-binding domain-containing protein [Candidatus Melainabacteria bacterium]MBX9672808.1 LON peptidase substrate-binding domain-containing protein [Candidatus Obscuribacterales bacterium]